MSAVVEDQPDGYWLKMGAKATEALAPVLRPDLTQHRKEIVSEYIGGVLDMAYKMGIRHGELSAKLKQLNRQ